jgi:outer membrane protein OmpA-like peptidoglycan-associated protein
VQRLPFDTGPQAAADTLIAAIRAMQAENQRLGGVLDATASQLKQTLARLGAGAEAPDAPGLAHDVDGKVAALLAEKTGLAAEVQAGQAKFAELSQEHAAATEELAARRDREERFRKAKALIGPGDGEVLYNPANDLVLRLSGLAFESGKSEIREDQLPLLARAEQVIALFPGARLIVEGHTDAAGDATGNVRLSERRAIAVMQYLRESLVIPADKISAMGYGSERPVASNQTAEGRAKNRRIDIIIMR